MLIQVIGMGCAACRRMEADTRAIVLQLGWEAQVEYTDDLDTIGRLALLALPGLAVDGRVIATGYSGRRRIEQLLREARDKTQAGGDGKAK
jgi:hypothetical protein